MSLQRSHASSKPYVEDSSPPGAPRFGIPRRAQLPRIPLRARSSSLNRTTSLSHTPYTSLHPCQQPPAPGTHRVPPLALLAWLPRLSRWPLHTNTDQVSKRWPCSPWPCCRIHHAERCWSLTDTVTGRTKNNAQKQPWDSHPRMDPHPSALRLHRGSLTPWHPARVHCSDTHGRLGCMQ